MRTIPYAKQSIDQNDIDAVVKVLLSDYLTTGPAVPAFEKALCEATGARYAVTVSNGTAALHAACFAAEIGAGDEVITSPMTFAASANCVLYCGGKPVFADVLPDTYNIDPALIEKQVTPKTKTIIPVHYTGQPAAMNEINAIAKKYGLIVIADGAHALGAEYHSKPLGQLADMTTLSFHPVKHITTGEGGAVLTNDEALYKKLCLFRSHGITRDDEQFTHNEGGWYYEQQILGYNYRMNDIQAALGSSQLQKLDMFVRRRRDIAKVYNDAFSDISGLTTPYQDKDGQSSWHLYVLRLDTEKLGKTHREIYDMMHERGIGANVHYIPVYYHPYYQNLGYKKGLCPNAERLYECIVSLPIYPTMTDEDIERVVEAVREALRK